MVVMDETGRAAELGSYMFRIAIGKGIELDLLERGKSSIGAGLVGVGCVCVCVCL
jgi:hypothetical protein